MGTPHAYGIRLHTRFALSFHHPSSYLFLALIIRERFCNTSSMTTRPRPCIDDLSGKQKATHHCGKRHPTPSLLFTDEIISLIIFQLADPGPLSRTSKRFHHISKDPYVRSSYFLARYGPQQAFYWSLSRSKLVNERVLDVRAVFNCHILSQRL